MDENLVAEEPQSPVYLFESLNVLPSFGEDILQQSLVWKTFFFKHSQ